MSRSSNFHWRHKARDVKRYIDGCIKCQQYKDSNAKKLMSPETLKIPERRWGSLATDFIVALPRTMDGFESVITCVDRLSRRVHFVKSKTTDTALDVADAFFHNTFKHHGLPDSVVSDRDSKLRSEFCKRLIERSGIQLKMSTSRHRQTDGASEVMNRMVENYLRSYCSYHQDDCDQLLPSAEFAYNSATSEDLGMSPFEIDLGWQPKTPLNLISGKEVPVQSEKDFKEKLKSSFDDAQFSYKIAKTKQAAESSHKYKAPSYVVGSRLWIHKPLFKDNYSKSQESDKLGAKRFGPFTVVKLIGKNAVKVDLPSHMNIHPVTHFSHTVPYIEQPEDVGLAVTERPAPVPSNEGEEYFVDKILSHRKRGKRFQFLTLMKGDTHHDAVWQPKKDFVDKDGTITEVWQTYLREH